MSTPTSERLKQARIAAEYETASDAAKAMGVEVPTYIHHENGTSGLSRAGRRYATFFRVSLDWLLTGRGEMRLSAKPQQAVPIMGFVGAGAVIDPITDPSQPEFETVQIPPDGDVAAYVVKGDSMRPRFLPGEIVLYDPHTLKPRDLAGQYAIVQTLDGRLLIKILQAGSREGWWRLKSFNADTEEVELMGAWRYLGCIAPASPSPLPAKPAGKKRKKARR